MNGPKRTASAGASLLLVIEDEKPIRRLLRTSLGADGYIVAEAATAEQGLAQTVARNPDTILLDLGLPDLDGIEVIRRLRTWTRTPIIVVTASERNEDKIAALDAGADDYVTKPFSVSELLARIRVALRRGARMESSREQPVFSVGELRVDLSTRQVVIGEIEVHLTRTEYRLLTFLVRHAGKVVSHRQLLTELRGPTFAENTQYLRVFMGQLRQKVEPDPAKPRYLVNEPGVGYRLKVR